MRRCDTREASCVCWTCAAPRVPFRAILDLVRENAASLATMRVQFSTDVSQNEDRLLLTDVDQLLTAAPRLSLLECGVCSSAERMLPLLRKEPPYAALRLTHACFGHTMFNADAVDMQSLLEAVASHAGLRGLTFVCSPVTVLQLEATVDVAIRLQLTRLDLVCCSLTPANLPALTRLLASCPFLDSIFLSNDGQPLIVGAGVPAFCAALRGSSDLKSISLSDMSLWDALPDSIAVLDALTGHCSLTKLTIGMNRGSPLPNRVTVGAALGRLVAADSRLEHLCRHVPVLCAFCAHALLAAPAPLCPICRAAA